MDRVLRIGVLGAARIAPVAVTRPAGRSTGASVVAVAARDRAKAEAFAARHGVAEVAAGYQDLIERDDLDAVYNPLPNGLHGRWTLAALEAGKHVLCEKPFTANATEAREVAEAADRSGLVVMEAFHYRYHPVAERMVAIAASGELGALQHVEASFCFPNPRFGDIRYRLDLAGGAMMDAGCYAVHMVRSLSGEEPGVLSATAREHGVGVDRAMRAELRFPSGTRGRVHASMWSSTVLRISARAVGDRGQLHVLNPLAPQLGHRIAVHTSEGRRVEHLTRRPTYDFQLDAFVAAVRDGGPVLTPPADAVANMAVIDDVYRAAGLDPREPTP